MSRDRRATAVAGSDQGPPAPAGFVKRDLASLCSLFVARLRAAGLPVGAEHAVRWAEVLELARPARLGELYWSARVTLVSAHGDLDRFDAVFQAAFGGFDDVAERRGQEPSVRRTAPGEPPGATRRPLDEVGRAHGRARSGSGGSENVTEPSAWRASASAAERLATTDFASLRDDELAALEPFVRALARSLPMRRSRRRRRHRSGDRLDLRATLRHARRHGGDPAVLERRLRRRQPRRLVALLDISASMEPYARVFLQALWAATRAAGAETFVFGTRLTRLTPSLRNTDPDAALARAARRAPDWSGGTRIGRSMKEFLDLHGRRGMARGAVVLVLSDGWERDDPALLGAEMAALARLAYRIVWVNPRSAAPGFEPLAGGMAAALPHVDLLTSGHDLRALERVLDQLVDPRLSR